MKENIANLNSEKNVVQKMMLCLRTFPLCPRQAALPGSLFKSTAEPENHWSVHQCLTGRSRLHQHGGLKRMSRLCNKLYIYMISCSDMGGKWNIKQHTQTCLLPSGSDLRLFSLFPLWTVTAGFCLPGRCTGLLSVARPGTSSCPASRAHVEGLSLLAAFSLPPPSCFSPVIQRLDSVFLNNLFLEVSLF